MVSEPATLQSLSPLMLETSEVQVIDVSSQGLAVQLKRHLAPQTEVKVRRPCTIVFGQVVYCIPWSGGFRAGIRIRETIATPKSPKP